MENKLKSRDVFYGIVAIATLIVAIIGATLAYFSITANSAEGVVNATAATVSINYFDGQQVTAQADELIPATLTVVQKAYAKALESADADGVIEEDDTNVCIDDNDKQVCSIYRFSINSDTQRTVTAKLNNEHNEFTYLSYAIYDVNNKVWLTLQGEGDEAVSSRPISKCDNTNYIEETPAEGEEKQLDKSDDCYSLNEFNEKVYTNPEPGTVGSAVNSIFGLTLTGEGQPAFTTKLVSAVPQVYDIVLFIKENDGNQNIDQGANYRGTIVVEVTDSGSTGHITGKMD